MKKFFTILFSLILFIIPISYADEFDTNIINKNATPNSSSTDSAYKYWGYYENTGTRYVIRVYDLNTGKYIAVPKEYYINHIYGYTSSGRIDFNKEILYLGVDKTSNGKYDVVKSGTSIFADSTYSHIITWYNNPNVVNFGLTKDDVKLLAEVIKDAANKKGNMSVVRSMQNIIDGIVPYDVRAEILFLMKIPGTDGAAQTATVCGKGSLENYNFTFYNNSATKSTPSSSWRKEYITYSEIKAICYKFGDDCGLAMKATWLDKIACALYEKDREYVFYGNQYQCSCDLYKRKFGNDAVYTLNEKLINLNKPAYNPSDNGDRWYMYYTPGRCGIPVKISNTTYYITTGQTYNNLGGNKMSIDPRIKYSDSRSGLYALNNDDVRLILSDASSPALYEGWDYITNKMASVLIVACDKDTGNIITSNNITYSKFESVKQGNYNEKAWDIPDYEYLGNIIQNNFSLPNAPIGIMDTSNNVDIKITSNDVNVGAKKLVVFVYQKRINKADNKELRLSVYNISNGLNTIMYTGKYLIDSNNTLSINLYDKNGNTKYSKSTNYNSNIGYELNATLLESVLGVDKEKYEYVGSLVKVNPEYFLTYLGETLNPKDGEIYNLKNIGENKVHVILGYMLKETPVIPPLEEKKPELKISYIDENYNPIPGKTAKITQEVTNVDIESKADDLRKDDYMYIGYIYIDTKDNFGDIVSPLNISSKESNIITNFKNGNDRRHIAFIYKKIELKFEIDITMEPNNLANQLIGQKENEDYWVLDEAGKVTMKVNVSGTDGLNISNYAVKLRIPFDTFMNGTYIKANTINNLAVQDLEHIIVADKIVVPVWVREGNYDIDAVVSADIDGFGTLSASKKDNVEIVGRLYDFTVTNLDGSSQTGDEKWKNTLFIDENIKYKANSIPIGQSDNQPEKYNYGIKLGTTFYFSINTKGIKNGSISITPKFLYVTENENTIKDVDVYINDNGKIKNILDGSLSERYMKLRDDNILKSNVIKEIERAILINKVSDRYNYLMNINRNIGKFANMIVPKYLSLPYLKYIDEFENLYGLNAIELSGKTEDEILTYASHWYGRYFVPSNAVVVDKGESANGKAYKDGYLIVLFKIISLDNEGKSYLSYNLPIANTQWQKENANQIINLPIISMNGSKKSIILDTIKDGFAPVIIYQVGISTKSNNTSEGTH